MHCRYLLLAVSIVTLSGCVDGLWPDHRMKVKGNISAYQKQLEENLCQRYNNTPKWAGKVSKVELVLVRPPEESEDKRMKRVEFAQLVYDPWGNRIPVLEEEYFIITFGDGHPRVVRTDPSVTVGLKSRGSFSESSLVSSGPLGDMRRGNSSPVAPREKTPPAPMPAPKEAPAGGQTVPVVPVAEDPVVPTQLTGTQPSLLQAMTPPAQIGTTRHRAEVRNLPPEPELDDF